MERQLRTVLFIIYRFLLCSESSHRVSLGDFHKSFELNLTVFQKCPSCWDRGRLGGNPQNFKTFYYWCRLQGPEVYCFLSYYYCALFPCWKRVFIEKLREFSTCRCRYTSMLDRKTIDISLILEDNSKCSTLCFSSQKWYQCLWHSIPLDYFFACF